MPMLFSVFWVLWIFLYAANPQEFHLNRFENSSLIAGLTVFAVQESLLFAGGRSFGKDRKYKRINIFGTVN